MFPAFLVYRCRSQCTTTPRPDHANTKAQTLNAARKSDPGRIMAESRPKGVPTVAVSKRRSTKNTFFHSARLIYVYQTATVAWFIVAGWSRAFVP